MKPVSGEFLKEGALSIDRLIEERAPPMLNKSNFHKSVLHYSMIMCERPSEAAGTQAHSRQKPIPQLTPERVLAPRSGPANTDPPKPLQGQHAWKNLRFTALTEKCNQNCKFKYKYNNILLRTNGFAIAGENLTLKGIA